LKHRGFSMVLFQNAAIGEHWKMVPRMKAVPETAIMTWRIWQEILNAGELTLKMR
jgi:hypothetical protein